MELRVYGGLKTEHCARAKRGAKTSLRSWDQRVPDFGEAEVTKVFAVGGGELGDTVTAEGQGQTDIENSPTGKISSGRPRPDFRHHISAIDQLPVGVRAEYFAFFDRACC